VLTLVAATLGTGLAASPPAAPGSSAVPAGLPSGVPQAALDAPATLPTPDGWSLAEPFPRTSGTGRMEGGVFGWSDFVYDDHGAGGPVGTPTEPEAANLAPTAGTYTYPEGAASNNGADVFRTAFALDGDDAFFRVDWQTLADPGVPIAAFGLDTTPGTGAPTPFAGDAGVSATGLERTLLVSSRGATLVEAVTGASQDVEDDLGGSLTVDPDTQSFVVRLPREALSGPAAPGGGVLPAAAADTWRLWLVAGLADDDGTGFAPPPGLQRRAGGEQLLVREHAGRPADPGRRHALLRRRRHRGPRRQEVHLGAEAHRLQQPLVRLLPRPRGRRGVRRRRRLR
jgi:hypothetical protein